MSRALVIRSPHSSGADKLSAALSHLKQASIDVVDVISIASLDGLPDQGRAWMERGIDIAIAAGGDGVVGGVITHIAECGLLLGILPLGTANDIARSLDIPQDVQKAAETIAHGRQVEVDIGIAQPAEQALHSARPERGKPVPISVASGKHGYFAHALTVGMNVQFARLATNVATRKRFGKLTYSVAAIEVLKRHTALDMELRFEGLALQPTTVIAVQTAPTLTYEMPTLRSRVLQATIINAPIFGGPRQLAIPGASLRDRLLDIVVIDDIDLGMLREASGRIFNNEERHPTGPADWHKQYPALNQAELSHIPGIHHVQARGVLIATSVDPQDVTLDGEVRGQTPGYARVADQRLRVVVPATPTVSIPFC
jgi:diacylglycerol kinase (ATP)